MDLLMNARTIMGIIEGDAVPDLFIPQLLDLFVQGRFPYDRLIEFFPFDAINDAVAAMEQGRVTSPCSVPDPEERPVTTLEAGPDGRPPRHP